MTSPTAKYYSEAIWHNFRFLSQTSTNFLPSICLVFGWVSISIAHTVLAQAEDLGLQSQSPCDTYWPRCSRPRAYYGLRWRANSRSMYVDWQITLRIVGYHFFPDWQPPLNFVQYISNFLGMCSNSMTSAHVILK